MSLLITLKGIEGSGKTTLINNLKKSGELEIITNNWQDTELGQKVWHLTINNKQEVIKKTTDLPLPDITFFLDIDPQKVHGRIKKNIVTNRHDNWDKLKLKFQHKIRKKYLELKKLFPERIYILDANRNENEILEEVQSIIKKCLLDEENKNNLSSFKNEKGELLLVKDKKWGWNLPGGKIELDETPEIAACREVFEETNLEIDSLQKIGEEIIFFTNLPPGKQHWMGYFFQTDKYSGEIKNKGEVVDIKFFDINSKGDFAGENHSAYQFYLEKIKKLNHSQ